MSSVFDKLPNLDNTLEKNNTLHQVVLSAECLHFHVLVIISSFLKAHSYLFVYSFTISPFHLKLPMKVAYNNSREFLLLVLFFLVT